MTFLGMTQAQALLFLGATAAAIIVIFFLRIQHRRVLVSSSLLWERVLERRRRRSLLELLRKLLSLLIALAIGLSLAMVYAEAELGSAGREPRRVRIVVDTRPHMAAATGSGATRLDAARGVAQQLLAGGSGADSFSLFTADGRVIAPESRDREIALGAVETLQPAANEFRLPEPEEGVETWLVTDGVGLPSLPDDVRVVSAFEPGPNVGVSRFDVRPWPSDPFRHEAFLEVGNFGAATQNVTVELRDERGVQFRRAIELQAGGLYRNTFDLSPLEGGVLTASVRVEGDDALALDDAAYVYVPERRPVRVGLVGRADSAVAALLSQEPNAELSVMSPTEYEEWLAESVGDGSGGLSLIPADVPPLDGVVFEGWAPGAPPPVPALVIGAPAAPWLPAPAGMVREPEIDTIDIGDALFGHVDMHDVRIDRARRVDPGDARVMVADGDLPLLVRGSSSVAPWLLLTFALADSDFDQGLGFPIFVANLLHWFRGEEMPLSVDLGRVVVEMPRAAVVDLLSGERVSVDALGDRASFVAAAPGVFLATDGQRRQPVAVRAGGSAISAINRGVLAEPTVELDVPPRSRRLWPALLVIAALLLFVEGVTYHNRITV